jgi:cytochrome c-type biogenesis protein CcmH/NrfF
MIRQRSARRAIFTALFFAPLLALLSTAAFAQSTDHAKQVGQKLICACGCNQGLTVCNHVGCTYSTTMLKELDDRIARGGSDDLVLQSFVQEYGPTVLAEPPAKGFNMLAYVMPVLVPIVAILLVWGLAQRWRERSALAPAGGPPVSADLLDRARHETRGDDE